MSEDDQTIFDGPEGGRRPEPTPEWIGPYKVEGRLGAGGMGEVFLAWDERLERRVAIKRIRREAGLSADQRERFRREARLAARLSHPNIVQIYDRVSEGPDDAIVMEYIEGRTLADLLTGERLEMPEILRLACEIAEGLAAAHEARPRLVHRDLKAANVMVTDAGHAKILDFGLARPVVLASGDSGLTRQGFILGTCHAMSPEQARGEEVDERSDLFSFGSLVHEMLTGRPPFRGEDPLDSMRKVLNEEPVHPSVARPDLPAEAAQLLLRLLKKDRDQRPSSAREVIAVLKRLQTAASRPSASRPPFWMLRRSAWIAGALAVLLVAGAAALFLTIRSTRPLRVAVILQEPSDKNQDLDLAGSAAHSAILGALPSLPGVSAIDPDAVTEVDGTPVRIAKAASTDEAITIKLAPEREGLRALVTLSRMDMSGKVLWAGQTSVSLKPENRLTLANAMISLVEKAFPGNVTLRGLDVREEDYLTFLDIQERVDNGEARREHLDQLEKITATSPRFIEAPILAARIAHSLFLSRREPADLPRAFKLVRKARNIDPKDPRPLRQELQIALTRNDLAQAETILEEIEQLLPGDPDILPLQADLAELRNEPEEAEALLIEAVEEAPSWQNRYLLAQFEARHDRIDAARERIQAIRKELPENVWAREAQGNLELTYGDLEQAEKIYGELVDEVPARALNNLATAQILRGRYKKAREIYRRARAEDPDRVSVLINLAEAETELRNEQEAETLYREAIELLEQSGKVASLTPSETLLKAQCHARLGERQEAIAIVQEQLSRSPEDTGILFQSVLVYSIAGERALARENAKAVLAQGFRSRWFHGSALQWLHQDAEVGPLLSKNF